MSFDSGGHVDLPGVEMIPVKAFRIEPEPNDRGHMTLDGEEVEYGPIQAEILPSFVNIVMPE